jgi:hypothetical protein
LRIHGDGVAGARVYVRGADARSEMLILMMKKRRPAMVVIVAMVKAKMQLRG